MTVKEQLPGSFSWRRGAVQPGWICLGVVLLLLGNGLYLRDRFPVGEPCQCPHEVVEWIRRENLRGNYFAPPNDGAYLGWRLKDRVRVFVDTRGFFFPPHVLEDMQFLTQLSPGWKTRLRRVVEDYPTDYLLLETDGPRGRLWQHLKGLAITPMYEGQGHVLLAASQLRQQRHRWDSSLATR